MIRVYIKQKSFFMFSKSIPSYPFTQNPEFKCIQKYFKFFDTKDYATDFGHIISNKPMGVFLPPNVKLLQLFLKLANEYKINIICRGKGNSAYGQSQCLGGIVIDLKNLDTTMTFTSNNHEAMTIPAFKTWLEVTNYSKTQNRTVPVTIDNLDLTVGGTLSFGALGGTSYRCGSGADNVLNLEVLTPDGEIHNCSKIQNTELFNAVLCGLGQFGIILNVTIPMVVAKQSTNMYLFAYNDISLFLKDQKKLFNMKVFDHLKGFVQKKEGKWEYVIEAACHFNDEEDQGIPEVIKLLSPQTTTKQTFSYWEFINQVTAFVQALQNAGKLNVPHPWYNALLTEVHVEEHLLKVLESSHLTGSEPIIVYPMNSELFNQPSFMKPDGSIFYLLGVLYNTSFDATPDFAYNVVLKENDELYEDVKKHHGSRYLVDANGFKKDDWPIYYGARWEDLCRLKDKYDPNHLLSTGFSIYPDKFCKLDNKGQYQL